jgi:hypothetical protein
MVGNGYNELVNDAVRFTYSGDYLHSAPWSVGEQGSTNVSHGCVNLSPEHAAMYYNLATPGDPVTVIGSPKSGRWGDGFTVWFLTWKKLLKGSATNQTVQSRWQHLLVSPSSVTQTPETSRLAGASRQLRGPVLASRASKPGPASWAGRHHWSSAWYRASSASWPAAAGHEEHQRRAEQHADDRGRVSPLVAGQNALAAAAILLAYWG